MRLQGLSVSELRQVVGEISEMYYDHNLIFNREPEPDPRHDGWIRFTLRVEDSSGKGARRNPQGRRMVSACWHAHRDVASLIFQVNPEARLHTAVTKYDGRDHYLTAFPETGERSVWGSTVAKRVTPRHLCECEARTNPNPVTR